jgi:hypothetical protein
MQYAQWLFLGRRDSRKIGLSVLCAGGVNFGNQIGCVSCRGKISLATAYVSEMLPVRVIFRN